MRGMYPNDISQRVQSAYDQVAGVCWRWAANGFMRYSFHMPKQRIPSQSLVPLFEIEAAGKTFEIADTSAEKVQAHYKHPNGTLYVADSLQWLKGIEASSVNLVFADPPYNIGKADWDNFADQKAYLDWSLNWIREASRTLKNDGSLYICGFSEILADVKCHAAHLFHSCRWLVWHYKNKANLGGDWGRSHESILHFRKSNQFKLRQDDVRLPYGAHTLKYPVHPQAASSNFGNGKRRDHWQPHPLGAKPKDVIELPTTCNGMGETTPHPTQKPEELLRKLILAATDEGDLVIDPFSGSGTTVVVAEQLRRKWMGCDINQEYNAWAIKRVESVQPMSVAKWIQLDRANAERRESIRR